MEAPIVHPVAREVEGEESSDEDEGIEEATASKAHRSASGGDVEREEGKGSPSDGSGSFVHVPSVEPTATEAIESKFPALSLEPKDDVIISPPLASPLSENDTFEDASARSVFDDTPSRDMREGAPSPPASISGATASSTKKRAAPPPPVRAATLKEDTPELVTKPHDDFDDFDDLPPPAPVASAPIKHEEPTMVEHTNDFDSFDDEFATDFPSHAVAAKAVSPPPPFTTASNAFDESFVGFESSFAPPTHAPFPATTTTSTHDTSAFSFDDAFGSSEPTNLAASLGRGAAPPPPPRPVVSAPPPTSAPPKGRGGRPSDIDLATEHSRKVEEILSMGFNRKEAIDALEKYDYDVQRSINSLL